MKQVYAVAVLALVLVFALGSVASAGVLRGENFDDLGSNPLDDGDPDENHPWGGDRVIDGGDDGTTERLTPLVSLTSNIIVDLMLTRLVSYFRTSAPTAATSVRIKHRREFEKSYRYVHPEPVIRINSRFGGGKVVAR